MGSEMCIRDRLYPVLVRSVQATRRRAHTRTRQRVHTRPTLRIRISAARQIFRYFRTIMRRISPPGALYVRMRRTYACRIQHPAHLSAQRRHICAAARRLTFAQFSNPYFTDMRARKNERARDKMPYPQHKAEYSITAKPMYVCTNYCVRDRCPRVYVCCIRNTTRLVIMSRLCLLCKGDRRRVWKTQRAAHSLGIAYQEFYYYCCTVIPGN